MKKKIFLLITVIISTVLIFTNAEEKEVNAATCETYYNYYLLLDATNSSTFLNGGNNGTNNLTCSNNTCTRTDAKYFKLPVPEDATNKESGLVTLYQSLSNETYNKWHYETFYNYYKQLDDIGDNYTVSLDETSGTKKYIASSIPWTNNSGVELSTHTNIGTFVEFQNASIINNAAITMHGNVSSDSEDFYNIQIKRTWNESQMQAIQTIYNNHGSVTVWSPAVYYVKYELCEEEEEEPTYMATIMHIKTGDRGNPISGVPNKVFYGPDGFEYECPETLDEYNVPGYILNEERSYYTTPYANAGMIYATTIDHTYTEYCQYDEADVENKVIVHHYIENTTTKIKEDKIDVNVDEGSYSYACPSPVTYNNLDYTKINNSVSVEMQDDSVEELICYYKAPEKTYTLTVNYGTDEDCTGEPVKKSETYTLKEKATKTIEFESKIGSLSNPTLGTYSKQFTTKPIVKNNKLSVTMPANDVSICIVYTPQTGVSWIYFAWIIAIGALGYSAWYFVQYYKAKKNNV